ncbi:MAG TPA: hypothetical protein VNE63_05370 [Candidatus Acidoferrales bacterium]|nr:hypothetical protein [Candidatus Acidoferrales bacterium]
MSFQQGNPGGPGRFHKRKSTAKLSGIDIADDADIKEFLAKYEQQIVALQSRTSGAKERNRSIEEVGAEQTSTTA